MISEKDKQVWIDALRSGKYKQGKGQLKHANQHGKYFCCLGVAEELGLAKRRDRWYVSFDWLDKDTQAHLADMNDGRGESFNYIANIIEQEIMVE